MFHKSQQSAQKNHTHTSLRITQSKEQRNVNPKQWYSTKWEIIIGQNLALFFNTQHLCQINFLLLRV
jgi:hypothetical protein